MMKPRMIDAEALKKEVENLVAGGAERLKDYYENGSKKEENEWIGGVYDVWELIDNAPTLNDKAYSIGYAAGSREGYTKGIEDARQTGEWIMNKTSPRGRNYTCSHCKKISRNKSEYCPKCGARMEA